MAYKKIVVDNIEYKYTLGRTHLKVRGIRVVPTKEEVGTLVDRMCDCGICDLTLRETGNYNIDEDTPEEFLRHWIVLPSDIAKFIQDSVN
jgi:hypothetical protein